MSEVFKVGGTVTIKTEEAVKGLDDVVAKGKEAAEDIKKQADGIGKSVEDGLDIPVEKYRKQSDDVVRKTRQTREEVEGQAQGIRGAMQNAFSFAAGDLLSEGLREAWQMAKEFAMDSLSVASDLAEVQNVVDVTFGEGASQINAWAKSAKNAFGMGELKAKQFSGTMGAMLKSMGFTGDEAMGMSTNLVQLAGDMASFYNLDHETAFEKIRAGISGETEPLKQLGINMSVANLEAYAMSQGIDKAYESMTQAEQAALRYNYLISATADAAGDFNRTSDSYANQVKLLQENLDIVKGRFGNALVEILTPQLQGINALLNDWLEENPLEEIANQDKEEQGQIGFEYETAAGIIEDMTEMETAMGDAVYETDEWNAALKALSRTMPELGEYIDLNTGKIKIGTGELLEHAKAIRDVKLLAAAERTLSSYNSVVDDRYQALVDNQTELFIVRNQIKTYDDAVNDLMGQLNLDPSVHDPVEVLRNIQAGNYYAYTDDFGFGRIRNSEAYKTLFGEDGYQSDVLELKDKEKELEYQQENLTAAYNESVDAAKQAEAAVAELTNENTEAAEAGDAYVAALEEEKTALNNVSAAVKELQDYYNGLRVAARASLESVVGGFEKVEQLAGASKKEVSEAMQSQNAWLHEYKTYLEEAQSWGLDADLLAQLSDGSAESASILKMLSQDEGYRAEFNKNWLTNQELADETAELMAKNQAAADEKYQQLVDNAETTADAYVEAFNKREAAYNTALDMGAGFTSAMAETINVLRQQAIEVNTILGSMFGSSWKTPLPIANTSGVTPVAHNAKGLGYVPYDNYLTRLHKGETVLNRVEADERRRGAQNAGSVIDYDRLASALAAQMGGITMQMDGRMIGALVAPAVSRNLEREAYRGRY